MTSQKQLAANRENARKSTGPRTEAGRAIAKLNAVKHGGLSPLPVLPEVETHDAWEAHLDGTLASLRPVGHLETVLAERVALILWRMDRLARFEREITAVGQERVVDDITDRRRRSYGTALGPHHPDELRGRYRDARRMFGTVAAMYRRAEDAPMTGEEAEAVLTAVAERTANIDPETFSTPEVVTDDVSWFEFTGWTIGGIRRGVAAMAAAEGDGATEENLLLAALHHSRAEMLKLKAETEKVARDLDHLRRERLLPDVAVTDRVARYEAHLGRQLAQALHGLQRLQVARAGDPTAHPVVVDVAVSGTEEG